MKLTRMRKSNSFAQFSKDVGGALLGILMGTLQKLVTKLQSFEETSDSKPAAEKSQEESDLFMEVNRSPTVEASKEQVGEGLIIDVVFV